jgi:hypothetical protein
MAPSKIYDFDPRNLPRELLNAIGLAIAASAQTEGTLDWAIAGCAGINAIYGAAITGNVMVSTKLNILSSIAEARINDPHLLADIDDSVQELRDLFGTRNQLAHDKWCRDEETGETFRVDENAKTQVAMKLVPTAVRDIETHAASMYEAGMKLMRILIATDLLPEVPDGPRQVAHPDQASRKAFRKARVTSAGRE